MGSHEVQEFLRKLQEETAPSSDDMSRTSDDESDTSEDLNQFSDVTNYEYPPLWLGCWDFKKYREQKAMAANYEKYMNAKKVQRIYDEKSEKLSALIERRSTQREENLEAYRVIMKPLVQKTMLAEKKKNPSITFKEASSKTARPPKAKNLMKLITEADEKIKIARDRLNVSEELSSVAKVAANSAFKKLNTVEVTEHMMTLQSLLKSTSTSSGDIADRFSDETEKLLVEILENNEDDAQLSAAQDTLKLSTMRSQNAHKTDFDDFGEEEDEEYDSEVISTEPERPINARRTSGRKSVKSMLEQV